MHFKINTTDCAVFINCPIKLHYTWAQVRFVEPSDFRQMTEICNKLLKLKQTGVSIKTFYTAAIMPWNSKFNASVSNDNNYGSIPFRSNKIIVLRAIWLGSAMIELDGTLNNKELFLVNKAEKKSTLSTSSLLMLQNNKTTCCDESKCLVCNKSTYCLQ